MSKKARDKRGSANVSKRDGSRVTNRYDDVEGAKGTLGAVDGEEWEWTLQELQLRSQEQYFYRLVQAQNDKADWF